MKIIITENQLRLIKEAVGVPEGILNAAEQLYDRVSEELKSIDYIDNEYEFDITDNELQISDIQLNHINLNIEVHKIEDYEGKPEITSMGVSNQFRFDNKILMQISPATKTLVLHINFVVSEDWKPEQLLESSQEDEVHTVSVMAHELKHKYDRTKKLIDFVGRTAQYQTYSSGRLNFGVPVLNQFMRYSYFIQATENLVRPTEISTRMLKKGITKEQFYDFITNDIVYKELRDIKNFSFEYLVESLNNQMDNVDRLLDHAGLGTTGMDNEEKIKTLFRLVYINLVNAKIDTFDQYFYSQQEMIDNMFGGLMGQLFGGGRQNTNPNKEKVRNKFINHIIKYQDNEVDFFKDECERFNYVATNLMKKISKIYSLIPDEKEQTNESILNWDLHQKLMEKKYGKKPIQTSYNFKK